MAMRAGAGSKFGTFDSQARTTAVQSRVPATVQFLTKGKDVLDPKFASLYLFATNIYESNSKSYQQVRGTGHEGYSMMARAHLRHVHKQVARAAATPLPDSPPQQSVFGNVPASVPRYIYTLYK
jgi:hypothetical protein